MNHVWPTRLLAVTRLPEFNVALFAILLNYPWEFLQVPLFDRMPDAPHWEAIKSCTRATLGDAVIMLIAYGSIAAVARDRRWFVAPRAGQVALFSSVGVSITIAIERMALGGLWMGGWAYASDMPIVPVIGVGLSPVLQWVVLPPLVVWFVRRQLASTAC